ncbi:voltage-dependent anion channel-domain-containing protein [Dichomitus squalens]|nr:voltage-dependent anion channel-domain-containing protein [Dichomitus squalens]
MGPRSAKYTARLVECIRHFTPAWFAAIMGTGVIAILWHNSPYAYDSRTVKVFAYTFFFLNLLLFIFFNILTILRYTMFPEICPAFIYHPTQSLFLGTYPMGAATLINVAVGVIYTEDGFGGKPFLYTLWAFWWVDVALSVMSAYGIVHIMFTRQKHALESVTAVWLLPVVPLVVISSSGGVLAAPLLNYSASNSLITLVISTVLVIMGLTLAFMMLSLYFLRLAIHGVPRGGGVVSVYIPLGPLGQGGYSILLLGAGFNSILPLHYGSSAVLRLETVGQIIEVATLGLALTLWSMASLWLVYGAIATIDVIWHEKILFRQAFWSLVFPNGVYANLTIQLYRVTDSTFFRVWGAIYALTTLVFGAMFRTPCLDDVDIHAAAMEKGTEHARSPITDVEAAGGPESTAVAANGRRYSDHTMSSGSRRTPSYRCDIGRRREEGT